VSTLAVADTARAMPATRGGRVDAAHAAVAALREEQRRLERIGFELPLARCQSQLRYWRFVHALVSIAAADAPPRREAISAWPVVADR
jgi:hypothetical protein